MSIVDKYMFQYPSAPHVLSQEKNKAIIEISPLYPGYGVTIGNVMRRTLMSSLEGAAITSVRIKSVDHEFSTIEGVLEDVIDIILNLKKIRFRLFNTESVSLDLKVKGDKKITAKDIKTTSEIEVVNPDQHIATITDKKAEVEMTMTIAKGVGYIPVEQRQKEKLTVGEIAIDGIFTPVRNVNFAVENIRVEQRTDFNKVTFDIETDGSISPIEAFDRANSILMKHFEIMSSLGGTKGPKIDESIVDMDNEGSDSVKEKKNSKK